jgi:hypothetical protein
MPARRPREPKHRQLTRYLAQSLETVTFHPKWRLNLQHRWSGMMAVRCLKPRLLHLTLAHFEYSRTLIVARVLGQMRLYSQTYFRLIQRSRLLQKAQTHLGLGWPHQSCPKTRR